MRTRLGYSALAPSHSKKVCASSLYCSFSLTLRRPYLLTKSIESPATENMPEMEPSFAIAFSSGIGQVQA